MWRGTHRYDIQVLATHTRQHGCTRSLSSSAANGRFLLAQKPSFSKLFIPRTNGLVCRRVLCVLCTKCTLHSNHRLTRVIFQHTKRLLPRSGHFLSTYIRITQRHKCELRWKTTCWGEKVLICSFCLYRFCKYVSCGFPIINFCNPGVHYETPCRKYN